MTFFSLEQDEINRRRPIMLRQFKALAKRIHDIRRFNPEDLHPEISDVEQLKLFKELMEGLLQDDQPELKRSVVRKMANKFGNYLLWRRETSTPVIHELGLLLPWWIANLPGNLAAQLRDLALVNILNGVVMPIQKVWQDVLSSRAMYIGHCACRSAGIVSDLKQNDKVVCLVSEEDNRKLLDRLVDRYEDLYKVHGTLPDTDPKYEKLLRQLSQLRQNGSSDYRLETLFQETYSSWELLPVLEDYTSVWIRSMHRNHKAHLIHKELAFELVNIQYLARGSIFSSMKLIDTPYTICTCPTPELDGGCVLTNWYYMGMSNASLLPNEKEHGRLKDENGEPMPCQHFHIRNKRSCIGCGCNHEAPEPRSVNTILQEADQTFTNQNLCL